MPIDPNSREFVVIFGLFIGLVIAKLLIVAYLGNKLLARRKEGGASGSGFITAVLIMFIGLVIARIFYIIFDFYYTKFDVLTYPETPNIWFWKLASATSIVTILPLLWFLDKKTIDFKLKGIPVYFLIIGLFVTLLYPVATVEDFQRLSLISVVFSIGVLLIPAIFLNLAIKSSGEMRKTSILFIIGLIMYAIMGLVINEGVLGPLKEMMGPEIQLTIYIISTAGKIVSLAVVAYGTTKFQA